MMLADTSYAQLNLENILVNNWNSLFYSYCAKYPQYCDDFTTLLKLNKGNLAISVCQIVDFLLKKGEIV